MNLIKLLYLADREALARWGRSITTASYVAMPHGPSSAKSWTSSTNNPSPPLQNRPGRITSPSLTTTKSPSNNSTSLAIFSPKPRTPFSMKSSPYGHLTRWQIRDFAHTLPEWHDPLGSAFPITVADILKAQQKSPEEIRAIKSDLAELAQIDSLLTAPQPNSNFRRHALI
jgi:hypothetical protein